MHDFYALSHWFSHFHFMRPGFVLLILPFYFVLKSFQQQDDHLVKWRKVMSTEMLAALTVAGSDNKGLSPQKNAWIICGLIIVILMGPTWRQQPSPFTQDKSALVIALDVSDSMEQSDVQPSRLLRAKQKILDLLAVRGDSLTALIAYAGSAHVVMPVTNDSDMISHFLDVLDKSIIPKQGKIPHNIIELADELLAPTLVPGSVLLLTDGASKESSAYFNDYFSEKEHQFVVWGIGDATKQSQPEQGSSLIPLQIGQLESLVQGHYSTLVLMSHDKSDVKRVNGYLKNNPVISDNDATPWYDSGYPLLYVVAFLYLFWFRRGWTLQW